MNFHDSASQYLEMTILTVFLWIGLWGSISIFLDLLCKNVYTQLLVYFLLIFLSFNLLRKRNHI
jgi:hypothetical protein